MSAALVRDIALLGGLTLALSGAAFGVHSDFPFVAEPPDPSEDSCEAEELPPEQLPRLSVADLRAAIAESRVSVVDARSSEEFQAGHIPGAFNLPAHEATGILEVQSVPVDINDLVVTYCDGGEACYLSEYLAIVLRDQAQCKTVKVLDGGWAAWVDAKAPIEADQMTYAR
ncbi:MAG: rhodanese-like domain-containing protein [Myxococcales bacterium FL481]|nr:MAG: rhodanese-like domain-containing protein [Myxococcales bacterium FL481]